MEDLEHWRLCDELTVVQAALLLVGIAPDGEFHYVMNWEEHKRPEGFSAALAALSHAILGERLPANLHTPRVSEWDSMTESYVTYDTGAPDWEQTTVLVEDLKNWLGTRGVSSGFFFPPPQQPKGILPYLPYLDHTHSHYAPKLAAAVRAWEAVNAEQNLLEGKTVKQALDKWLRKNANHFTRINKNGSIEGLINDDGTINDTGVKETAKTANWLGGGGLPPTRKKRPPKEINHQINLLE